MHEDPIEEEYTALSGARKQNKKISSQCMDQAQTNDIQQCDAYRSDSSSELADSESEDDHSSKSK